MRKGTGKGVRVQEKEHMQERVRKSKHVRVTECENERL